MNRLLAAMVAVLAVLAAVQTLRLLRLQQTPTNAVNQGDGMTAGRADVARARLILEHPEGRNEQTFPPDTLADSLVEAMAVFLGDESSAGMGADGNGRAFRREIDGAASTDNQPEPGETNRTIRRAAHEGRRARRDNDRQAQAERAAVSEHDLKRSRQLHSQAQRLIQSGNYNAAMAALRDSIASDGTNAPAYRTLGALYRQLGMTTEELQLYADWSAARPDDALAHYYMANAYLRMGADADVLDALGRFQELSADNLAAYPMSASLYRRMGMPEAEGMVLEAWVDQVPQSFDARQALAQHYQRAGQHEAALAEYQMAAALMPGNAQAHASLGSAYARLGMFGFAQDEYAAAIALRPHDVGLHYHLAEVYRRANELPSALAAYESVIALQPASQQAQRAARMMARIHRQLSPDGKVLG